MRFLVNAAFSQSQKLHKAITLCSHVQGCGVPIVLFYNKRHIMWLFKEPNCFTTYQSFRLNPTFFIPLLWFHIFIITLCNLFSSVLTYFFIFLLTSCHLLLRFNQDKEKQMRRGKSLPQVKTMYIVHTIPPSFCGLEEIWYGSSHNVRKYL